MCELTPVCAACGRVRSSGHTAAENEYIVTRTHKFVSHLNRIPSVNGASHLRHCLLVRTTSQVPGSNDFYRKQIASHTVVFRKHTVCVSFYTTRISTLRSRKLVVPLSTIVFGKHVQYDTPCPRRHVCALGHIARLEGELAGADGRVLRPQVDHKPGDGHMMKEIIGVRREM